MSAFKITCLLAVRRVRWSRWLCFCVLLHSTAATHLRTCSSDREGFDLSAAACRIVLVRYREDYGWVQQLATRGIPHVVYNKGEPNVVPGVCEHPLWNFGTEAHGYMHDLMMHAHHPAQWTIFSQVQRGCRWTSPGPAGRYGNEPIMNAVDTFCNGRLAPEESFDFAWISEKGTQHTVHMFSDKVPCTNDRCSDRVLGRFLSKVDNTSHTHDKLAFASLLSLLRDIADTFDPKRVGNRPANSERMEDYMLSQKFSPCASFAVRGSTLSRLNLAVLQELVHLDGFNLEGHRCADWPRCLSHVLERVWPVVLGSDKVSFLKCAKSPCSSVATYNLSSLGGR